MEKEQEDVVDLVEPTAPLTTLMELRERIDHICCAEVLPPQKPKICETTKLIKPKIHCLCKTKRHQEPRRKPAGLPERDILFRPIRWRCKPIKIPVTTYEPSLGVPVGLTVSSFRMNFFDSNREDASLQAFATVLIAYAEYYITPEIEWDEKVLNRILLEGQNLLYQSKAQLPEGEQMSESKIRRSFKLCGNTFDINVNDPFLVGQVVGQEFPVPNLYSGLLKFFKKFRFCLLQIGDWYTLVWQTGNIYFVFDCFGRRFPDFRTDKKKGLAMLICLKGIENVSHLILNLSGLRPNQLFIIRLLQIAQLIPCGGEPSPMVVDRLQQFEIVNKDYALLRSSIHLGSKCFAEIQLRHSLPVAICALINAKIDPTPTWDTSVLDKILKLGAHFYKTWTQCDISLELGIQDIPNTFAFGQYMIQMAVSPMADCGVWKCVPGFRKSELSYALRRAFEGMSNVLVQIQGRTYAIWKKRSFFYIFDPYSHQCRLDEKKLVTGTLRMCGTFDRLCCIFTQVLLELFEESKFLIHLVKIIKLDALDKIKQKQKRSQLPCMCLATDQTDMAVEAESVNDSVLGVNGYECEEEPPLEEYEVGDLDSPGLSQIRLEDYTDLRKDFLGDSDEESQEDMEPSDFDDKPPTRNNFSNEE